MHVITFLKKRYKEHLVAKLKKLKELAVYYCDLADSYDKSSKSFYNQGSQSAALNASSFLNSYFSSHYYAERLTMDYDFNYLYTNLYRKTLVKIEKLEKKLKEF